MPSPSATVSPSDRGDAGATDWDMLEKSISVPACSGEGSPAGSNGVPTRDEDVPEATEGSAGVRLEHQLFMDP